MRARRARRRRGTSAIASLVALVASAPSSHRLRPHRARLATGPNPSADTSVKPAAGGSVPAVREIFSALDKKKPGKTRVVCQTVPSKKLRKHGSDKKLSKNKSIKALNKAIMKAAQEGLQAARARSRHLEAEARRRPRSSASLNLSCCGSASTKSIQDAVTAAHNNDRVEIMPGLYTEPKSRAEADQRPGLQPVQDHQRHGTRPGAVSYAYQFHCPNDQNLIAVLGRR